MNKNNGIKCHTSRGNRCLLISSSFYKMFFPDLMNKHDGTAIYENHKFGKYYNMKYFDMKFNIHLQHGHELALLNIINHAAPLRIM